MGYTWRGAGYKAPSPAHRSWTLLPSGPAFAILELELVTVERADTTTAKGFPDDTETLWLFNLWERRNIRRPVSE